jgi:serine protein kinase
VYNGDNIKETKPGAKSYQEYKDSAPKEEGFNGVSTRAAFKILSKVFNYDLDEVAADPVSMMLMIEDDIIRGGTNTKMALKAANILEHLKVEYISLVSKDIQTAYLDSYNEYGQASFDRYILLADHWIQDNEFRDPDTGQMFNRDDLDGELSRLEKPAGISNPKDFRHEVVNFALRHKASNKGKNPSWQAYEKLKRVIEKAMFDKTEDLLPVISFSGQRTKEESSKHDAFVRRMMDKGYTAKQTKKLVEWHLRAKRG